MSEQPSKRAARIFESWAWPTVFQKMMDGVRPFDVRKDKGYAAGDIIRYEERNRNDTAGQVRTGRYLEVDVLCVMHGTRTDKFTQPKRENPVATGYCVIGIKFRPGTYKDNGTDR